MIDCTSPLISLLPSLALVCPSNCGSGIFKLIMQFSPSLKSSPVNCILSGLYRLFLIANVFNVFVNPALNPSK